MSDGAPGSIRLDKWLWQARFAKTRGRAVVLIESGAVRLNAVRVLKPATPVRIGDGLSFALGDRILAVRIRDLGLRRGPAPEARSLYEELAPAGADTSGTEAAAEP